MSIIGLLIPSIKFNMRRLQWYGGMVVWPKVSCHMIPGLLRPSYEPVKVLCVLFHEVLLFGQGMVCPKKGN